MLTLNTKVSEFNKTNKTVVFMNESRNRFQVLITITRLLEPIAYFRTNPYGHPSMVKTASVAISANDPS